jgi:glycosyltransferase involved in cell wall biosynthesis
LLIVGKEDDRLGAYSEMVRRTIDDLHLNDSVIITGEVSSFALKAYFLSSHVFLTASEHEGFCVPLIEAMSMKMPVVAYGSSAIPDTVGKSGIVWEKVDPYLFAASLNAIATDTSLRYGLGNMGWERYHSLFTNEKIARYFLDIILKII